MNFFSSNGHSSTVSKAKEDTGESILHKPREKFDSNPRRYTRDRVLRSLSQSNIADEKRAKQPSKHDGVDNGFSAKPGAGERKRHHKSLNDHGQEAERKNRLALDVGHGRIVLGEE